MLVFISIMAVHCMHLLVAAARHLCKRQNKSTLDYGEVATAVLDEYGPGCLRTRSYIGTVLHSMGHRLWVIQYDSIVSIRPNGLSKNTNNIKHW